MTSRELYIELLEVPARVGMVVHLRTALVDGTGNDDLENLLEHMARKELKRIWPRMPDDAVSAFYDLAWDDMQAWVEELALDGFLIRVDTPVVHFSDATTSNFSWGHYTFELFYAATFDEAVAAGLAWAKGEHAHPDEPIDESWELHAVSEGLVADRYLVFHDEEGKRHVERIELRREASVAKSGPLEWLVLRQQRIVGRRPAELTDDPPLEWADAQATGCRYVISPGKVVFVWADGTEYPVS